MANLQQNQHLCPSSPFSPISTERCESSYQRLLPHLGSKIPSLLASRRLYNIFNYLPYLLYQSLLFHCIIPTSTKKKKVPINFHLLKNYHLIPALPLLPLFSFICLYPFTVKLLRLQEIHPFHFPLSHSEFLKDYALFLIINFESPMPLICRKRPVLTYTLGTARFNHTSTHFNLTSIFNSQKHCVKVTH